MSIQSIPDLVVKNANIITVDSNIPKAEALAIKNGRFIAIGSNKDIDNITTPQTKIYDAENRTIIPGLIDMHSHFYREYFLPEREVILLAHFFTY